jgi:leader peptidase (prepilin peptidase) / N-methyltransferase
MAPRSATERLAPASAPIQLRPVVALATFGLVVAALVRFGPSAEALGAAFVLCVVAAVAVVDLEERRIPNRIVLPAIAAALVAQIGLDPAQAPRVIGIALAAGLFFYLPMVVFRGGMGMGDVKLAVFLGAALGEAVIVAIAVAVMGAFFAAIAILIRNGADGRKSAIPFGPFLALGAAVAVFLT